MEKYIYIYIHPHTHTRTILKSHHWIFVDVLRKITILLIEYFFFFSRGTKTCTCSAERLKKISAAKTHFLETTANGKFSVASGSSFPLRRMLEAQHKGLEVKNKVI